MLCIPFYPFKTKDHQINFASEFFQVGILVNRTVNMHTASQKHMDTYAIQQQVGSLCACMHG